MSRCTHVKRSETNIVRSCRTRAVKMQVSLRQNCQRWDCPNAWLIDFPVTCHLEKKIS